MGAWRRGVGAGMWFGLLAAAGCAGNQNHIRAQAAGDFDCPVQQTLIIEEAVGTYKLAGCGYEAGYRCPELATRCVVLYMQRPAPAAPKSDDALGQQARVAH